MNNKISKALKGDLAGGMTAAMLTLPSVIILGPVVFAALGTDYIPFAIVSGLFALCFSNLGASLYSGIPFIINGPSPISSIMLASALVVILENVKELASGPEIIPAALVLLFLVVFLSGVIQMLFGLLKLGFLAKYIPYPVLAGLLNGTAIRIILTQSRDILGLVPNFRFSGLSNLLSGFNPFTLTVGIVTLASIYISSKKIRKIPAPFTGILVGTVFYYLLKLAGLKSGLGPVIGKIHSVIPKPDYLVEFFRLPFKPGFLQLAYRLTPISLGIAVINSLRTQMAIVSIDSFTGERSNSDNELISQGIGNTIAAVFGGIASTGLGTSSMANYRYGGRTTVSKLTGSLMAFAVLMVLSRAISFFPMVVLSAVILMYGLTAFDPQTFNLIKRIITKRGKKRHISIDIAIITLVTVVFIFIGVFEAVGMGILISLLIFVFKMSKDIIRRDFTSAEVHSSVHRTQEEFEYLSEYGSNIRVLELDGALFFGTTDRLALFIDTVIKESIDYIILDFKRVSEVDSTGANILIQIKNRCARYGITLALSSITSKTAVGAFLRSIGVIDNIGSAKCFEKMDYALTWAEDRLIERYLGKYRYNIELSLSELTVMKSFTEQEIDILSKHLLKKIYKDGSLVFNQGDESDGIYFIIQGRARITFKNTRTGEEQRIGILSHDSFFGEISTLDGQPRSATVTADERLICYFMPKEYLLELEKKSPQMSYKLLTGISRGLSMRFRIANKIATDFQS